MISIAHQCSNGDRCMFSLISVLLNVKKNEDKSFKKKKSTL